MNAPVLPPVPPLAAFYDVVSGLDFYYEQSDDPTVYRYGERRFREVSTLRDRGGPEYVAVFDAIRAARMEGKPFPARPGSKLPVPPRRAKAKAPPVRRRKGVR